VKSFGAGWAALILSEATYFALVAHGLGRKGDFVIFAFVYTFFYLITAFLVLIPASLAFAQMECSPSPWFAAPFGGLSFALIAAVVSHFGIRNGASFTILITVLWLIAGAVSAGTLAFRQKILRGEH
jgi:hypothetical protein